MSNWPTLSTIDQSIVWESADPGVATRHQASSPSSLASRMGPSLGSFTTLTEGGIYDTGDAENACDVIEIKGRCGAAMLESVLTDALDMGVKGATDRQCKETAYSPMSMSDCTNSGPRSPVHRRCVMLPTYAGSGHSYRDTYGSTRSFARSL